MLDEYLRSSGFVILHGFLLLIYIISFVRAFQTLRRERRALKALHNEPQDGLTEPSRLVETVNGIPDSMIRERLKRLAENPAARTGSNIKAAIEQISNNVSWVDDTIRYCVNGFVVVGLMGTLHGFYEMWRGAGGSGAPSSSDIYLANMSRALSISFFGLVLALACNFGFSLLKAARRRLMGDISSYLPFFENLEPVDSTVSILLARLFDPLNNLVGQLTVQNEQVLKGLIDAVNSRTGQLNTLIEDATKNWQTTIKEFKEETLTAVGNLQHSSALLSDSSKEVATTMKEVSRSLERTKDIGEIVKRLETTSASMVTRISEKFDKATNAWAQKLSSTVQDHRRVVTLQSDLIEKTLKGISVKTVAELKAATGQMRADLVQLQADFATKTDAIASDWMTNMSHGNNEMIKTMGGIVDGWQTAVTGTAASINTTLDGSNQLSNATAQNVVSLNQEVQVLQGLLVELSERAGAPLHLSAAAESLVTAANELAKIEQALRAMDPGTTRNREVGELRTTVESNYVLLKDLKADVVAALPRANGNNDIVEAVNDTKRDITAAIKGLEGKIKVARPAATTVARAPAESSQPTTTPHDEPQPSWWHPVKRRRWAKQQANKQEQSYKLTEHEWGQDDGGS